MDNPLIIFLSVLTGLAIGVVIMVIISKAGLNKDQQKASMLLKEAETKADSMVKQAVLDGRTQAHELKIAAEKEIKERKQEVTDMENKLLRREDNLNFRDETLTSKEKQIDVKSAQLADKMAMLDKKDKELQEKIDVQVEELERVASLTTAEAREELMAITEKRMEKETMAYIKEKEEEAKSIADEKARNIVALSIQRISSDEAVDRTVSVVSLPSEEMKGRIIGREGRNIKAIEQATGVDLIIDDTPETITVSCFDPIRREVARLALEHLIKDGRIQPGRIEEVVHKIKKEMDTNIMKTGEDTVFKLGIGRIDREIIRLIGRLKYRFSYGQNALQHSIEVANLTGMMAAELGLNQQLAKRAGLLHDIGKALDHEIEGSHISIGVDIAKKYKENPAIIHAIEAHHGDVEAKTPLAFIVMAADAISAARPGARRENLESYIKRLESLEEIASGFEGVERSFAIQAGREVRIMVKPDAINDDALILLAHSISQKIEETLDYPGQIKVNVIRESRAVDYAK